MVKNTLISLIALLLVLPFALAAAPVWTPIQDQQIQAGNVLTFMVSASDADGDPLTLDIAGPDIPGVSFTSNISGSGNFNWPTTINQVGVYDFIFSATSGRANETSETALETARITVTAAANTSLSPLEQEYRRVVEEFNELEDDYSLNKRRYERAVDEEDRSDIDDYGEELEDVDDDLADAEDDAEDLLEDVEDSTLSNRRQLADDVEDLLDDIERVRDRIDTLLNGDDEDESGTFVNSYTPPAPRVEPQPEPTRVVVRSLDLPVQNVANTVEQPDTWPETRKMVLVGAGIVVLAAIIIFLIALMV